MIRRDHCIHFGTIIKSHGIRGSFIIALKYPVAGGLNIGDSVFLEIDGLLVPYFIDDISERPDETCVLQVAEINSESVVKEYLGTKVYIDRSFLNTSGITVETEVSVTGYSVIDEQLGDIGIAGEIENIANNPLLHVNREKMDLLIPLHQDIILFIDHQKRQVRIRAPEGLFDI